VLSARFADLLEIHCGGLERLHALPAVGGALLLVERGWMMGQ